MVCTLLLSTGAEILPPDPIVSVGFVKLNLARLLILAGLLALLASRRPLRSLVATPLGLPIALLLAAGLTATLKWAGTEPSYRFVVESVALFYLTYGTVRDRPRAALAVAAAALVAVSLSALTGVAQVAQDDPTGFYRDGFDPVTLAPGQRVPEGLLARATGTFENPNLLAAHVLLLAPLGALAVALATSAFELRLTLGLAVALAYVGLLFTFSRVAAFAALLGWLLAAAASRSWRGANAAGGIAVAAIAVVAVLALAGAGAVSGFGRPKEWKATVEVIKDNPVYGVGLGRVGDVLRARDPDTRAPHGHNLFLNWWAEAGALAALAWLAILSLLLWWAIRGALRGELASRAALVALVGFVAINLVDHPGRLERVATAFWVVAGLVAAIAASPRGRERVPS